MKLKLTFSSEKEISLPIHYNYILQSFIYSCMDKVYSSLLHDRGISYEGKIYKLFTFSQIFGRRKIIRKRRRIVYKSPIHFYFSCALQDVMSSYVLSILEKEGLKLGSNVLRLGSVEVLKDKVEGEEIKVKTISPVTIHRTTSFGRTVYYNPYQESFYKLLEENMKNKARAFGVECKDFSVKPASDSKFSKVVTYYKNNFVIEAWKGKFLIIGNQEILRFVLKVGLGDRNSQGFGMVISC